MSGVGDNGAFKVPQAAQAQQKPGLEKNMAPPSEATKLESEGDFVEYVGSGKLKNKKAIITGGDSGIGRSVAILFAREGADVTIVYLPQEQEDAEFTKKEVEAAGRSCHLFSGDLSQRDVCRQAVEEHMRRYNQLNVLVNNASTQFMCKDFAQIDLDIVEKTFHTNVIQMMAVTKFALPYLSRGDTIINSTSVTAFRGSSGMVDYASTKGAIVSFTRALSAQLAPKGIRVNGVAPGVIYTPIQADTRDAESMPNLGAGSRAGRPGQPSEVATSYVFLASADSALYYGQIMPCYPLGD